MLLWSEARLYLHVILFVRMWVEIPVRNVLVSGQCHPLREDVSWNIVCAWCSIKETGHPLREDVSWNKESKYIDEELRRHPLREDVSWNTWWRTRKPNRRVILFVRMWVEILSSVFWTLQCREDVSWNNEACCELTLRLSHPLREDVSWNVKGCKYNRNYKSSSSWGCELKYFRNFSLLH